MDYYEMSLQRKEEIETGLLELMQSIPYTQITVTSLANHLGMSRKCFYNYFTGKDACLESLTDRMIQEAALHIMINAADSGHHLQRYIQNLEYWKTRQAFLNAIIQNGLDAVFLNRCMVYNLKEERGLTYLMNTAEQEFDADILYFCLSGQIGLLLHWCRQGFEPSEEKMAQKFYRLFCFPLIRTDKK